MDRKTTLGLVIAALVGAALAGGCAANDEEPTRSSKDALWSGVGESCEPGSFLKGCKWGLSCAPGVGRGWICVQPHGKRSLDECISDAECDPVGCTADQKIACVPADRIDGKPRCMCQSDAPPADVPPLHPSADSLPGKDDVCADECEEESASSPTGCARWGYTCAATDAACAVDPQTGERSLTCVVNVAGDPWCRCAADQP